MNKNKTQIYLNIQIYKFEDFFFQGYPTAKTQIFVAKAILTRHPPDSISRKRAGELLEHGRNVPTRVVEKDRPSQLQATSADCRRIPTHRKGNLFFLLGKLKRGILFNAQLRGFKIRRIFVKIQRHFKREIRPIFLQQKKKGTKSNTGL